MTERRFVAGVISGAVIVWLVAFAATTGRLSTVRQIIVANLTVASAAIIASLCELIRHEVWMWKRTRKDF